MAHISLPGELPGMQVLLAYRPAIAPPLLQLMQVLMREKSVLSMADRELLAAAVSTANHCSSCSGIHGAIAAQLSGKPVGWVHQQCVDDTSLAQPLQQYLALGKAIAHREFKVGQRIIAAMQLEGVDTQAIHDVVLIASLFTLFNKYIDGLGLETKDTEASLAERAKHIAKNGYHTNQNHQDGLD